MWTKTVKITKDLPIIVGKAYATKFATKDVVIVHEIIKDKTNRVIGLKVVYENNPDQICPLDPGRLILDTEDLGTQEVCSHCFEAVSSLKPIERSFFDWIRTFKKINY